MPDFATYVALDDCDETADPGQLLQSQLNLIVAN